MRLSQVNIKNFRNIHELKLNFSDISILVGENNIGKTNTLMAISKILKMGESPYKVSFSEEDFYLDESSNERSTEIIIELTFCDLDENDNAVFLSRGIDITNNLISIRLEAKWEEENNDAIVDIFYYRNDDESDSKGEQFKLTDKKYIPFYYINAYRDIWRETQYTKGDLKQIFKEYNKQFLKPLNIQIGSLVNIIDNYIKSDATENEDNVKLLKIILSELQESNFDSLKDNKEKLKSINNGLGKSNEIFEKIIFNLENIIKRNKIKNIIIELQTSINSIDEIVKIKELLKNNLSLFVPKGDLEIELCNLDETDLFDETKVYLENLPILKQGSGFQNSFVMAVKISRLLANIYSSEENISNLIIAIEEPEAHMHPHLERSLIKKLKQKQKELQQQGLNIQLIITTHSPFILSQVNKSDIILIKREQKVLKPIRFDNDFFQNIIIDLSIDKVKHFDYIFRTYPEIFLSRGVIIVEGRSEFGAFPEFVKIMPDIDLDELGYTIIYSEGKGTIKSLYLILKRISKCIAIRDNDSDDGTTSDDSLINDDNEYYYTTDYRDFEEEILNSVDLKRFIKLLIKVFPDQIGKAYIDFLKSKIPELKPLDKNQFISKLDEIILDDIEIDIDKLRESLKKNCKTSLFWSMLSSELKVDEIPKCYKDVIIKSKELVC